MMESNAQHSNNISTEEDTSYTAPLGIRNPLLPPKALGQTLLQPKFLYPLGTRSLISFEASDFLIQEMPDYSLGDYSVGEEPFLGQSSLFLLESDRSVFTSNIDFASINNRETQTTLSRQTESNSPRDTSLQRQVEATSPTVRETDTSLIRQTESDSPELIGEIETSLNAESVTENITVEKLNIVQPQRENQESSDLVSSQPITTVQKSELIQPNKKELKGTPEPLESQAVKSLTPAIDSNSVETLPTDTTNPISTKRVETDSYVSVAQLFSQSKQLQALPTVLKNLVQSKPLGQSTSLGQASVETKPTSSLLTNLSSSSLSGKLPSIIQKMPEEAFGSYPEPNLKPPTRSIGVTNNNIQKSQITSLLQSSKTSSNQDSTNHILSSNDIPTSWSSIADLLGENTATDNQPSVIQRKSDKENYGDSKLTLIQPHKDETSGDLVFTPEGFFRADVSANNAKPRTTINNKAKKSVIQTKKSHSTATRDTETTRQRIESIESDAVTISAKKTQKEVDNNTLEILAQEIYRQVVSRLQVEKERQGRNYSGRQPW